MMAGQSACFAQGETIVTLGMAVGVTFTTGTAVTVGMTVGVTFPTGTATMIGVGDARNSGAPGL